MRFLVKKAKRHDNDAFVELMESQKLMMYKVARSYLRSDDDIADAIQETVLACYEYPLDENGNPAGEPTVETVDSKFVVVHMKVKNNNEVNPYDDFEVCVCPYMKYLEKDANGKYLHDHTEGNEYYPANEGYGLQSGFPVYFDKMYYTEGTQRLKHSHFVPMEPGEEMEYTLAYVADEDRLDDTFFQFYSGYGGWPVPEGGNEYVYVKVEQ